MRSVTESLARPTISSRASPTVMAPLGGSAKKPSPVRTRVVTVLPGLGSVSGSAVSLAQLREASV